MFFGSFAGRITSSVAGRSTSFFARELRVCSVVDLIPARSPTDLAAPLPEHPSPGELPLHPSTKLPAHPSETSSFARPTSWLAGGTAARWTVAHSLGENLARSPSEIPACSPEVVLNTGPWIWMMTITVTSSLADRTTSWLAARTTSWLAARTTSWLAGRTTSWLAARTTSWLAGRTTSWLACRTTRSFAWSRLEYEAVESDDHLICESAPMNESVMSSLYWA